MDFQLFSISRKGIFFPKYTIENEGDFIYMIKRNGFLLQNKYGFYDALGNEVMQIKRLNSFFKLKYELTKSGIHMAYIEQAKGMFKNNFVIDSPSHFYYVEGDFTLKSFTIFEDEREIAKISRKSFRSKRQYGIAMVQDADMNLILGSSFALEITRKIKKSRKSGS